MATAVDTNVLLISVQSRHASFGVAKEALKRRAAAGVLIIFPQMAAEFWNVSTRPRDRNGLGLTKEETRRQLETLESLMELRADRAEIYPLWKKLVHEHEVKGVQVHDARIAAAMQAHGIAALLTFNDKDFKRYPIEVLHPAKS